MAQEVDLAGRHAHDRLVYLIANLVGCEAQVTLKTQDRFTGIFSAASLELPHNNIVLKMCKRLPPLSPEQNSEPEEASEDYVGFGEDHAMTFAMKDVVIEVPNATADKVSHKMVNGSTVRTDTDISGNLETKERHFQSWQALDSTPGEKLGWASQSTQKPGTWDQFAANEQLYGVKSDYEETMYNTTIDTSAPSYAERVARAEKLAREIEGSATSNPHIAEERNLLSADVNGDDEEARFSGVARRSTPLTSADSNLYTIPKKRAPTGQATVADAPVDPAIISSSLANNHNDLAKYAAERKARTEETPAAQANSAVAPPQTASATSTVAEGTAAEKENKLASKGQANERKDAHLPRQSNNEARTRELLAMEVAKLKMQALHEQHIASKASETTDNTQHKPLEKVKDAFKDWAADEKLRTIRKQQEQQERNRLKDREVKINDLKKFSANFKLKTALPVDILGILARDKEKQKELQQKSQQELVTKPSIMGPPSVQKPPESMIAADKDRHIPGKISRGPPMNGQPLQPGKVDRTPHIMNNMPPQQHRIPGQLGQRLVSQYAGRGSHMAQLPAVGQDPKVVPVQPTPIITDGAPNRIGSTTPASAASRMRAQALEFRPNPAATSFQMPASVSSAATSPDRSRTESNVQKMPANRVNKFFKGNRPTPGSKKSLAEGFNPIARMRKEVIESNKTKDDKAKEFVANGGIPQAYRTAPVWPVSKENEEKYYAELADKAFLPAVPTTTSPYQVAAQHPPPQAQFNQPYFNGPRTPHFRQHQSREQYFDPHRMHPNNSQPTVPQSPSMRQPMMVPAPGAYRLENGQIMYPQPMTPNRHYPQGAYAVPAGAVGPGPMVMSHSNQGQYMGMPPQGQMPMYPAGQFFQGQGPPGGAFNSPRQAQMMLAPGQGQYGMPQYPYPMQMAPGFPQQGPQMQMRGAVPMMPQTPYGGSPQMMQHMSPQHRGGAHFNAGFPQQQMMHHSPASSHMPMRQPSDQSSDMR